MTLGGDFPPGFVSQRIIGLGSMGRLRTADSCGIELFTEIGDGGGQFICMKPNSDDARENSRKQPAVEAKWPPRCRRGDLFFANLNPVLGSEQGGIRPVLIVQNDRGNASSRTTIVAAVTSKTAGRTLPTHVVLPAERYGLDKDSVVLLEQIRTIDRRRLKNRIGRLLPADMEALEKALRASFGLAAEDGCRGADKGSSLGPSSTVDSEGR